MRDSHRSAKPRQPSARSASTYVPCRRPTCSSPDAAIHVSLFTMGKGARNKEAKVLVIYGSESGTTR